MTTSLDEYLYAQNALGDDGPDSEPTFTDRGITRRHVARRPGRCEHCPIGRGIRPGEAYTVYVGLDDDREFFHERHCAVTHDECRAAMPETAPPCRPSTGTYGPEEIPF